MTVLIVTLTRVHEGTEVFCVYDTVVADWIRRHIETNPSKVLELVVLEKNHTDKVRNIRDVTSVTTDHEVPVVHGLIGFNPPCK